MGCVKSKEADIQDKVIKTDLGPGLQLGRYVKDPTADNKHVSGSCRAPAGGGARSPGATRVGSALGLAGAAWALGLGLAGGAGMGAQGLPSPCWGEAQGEPGGNKGITEKERER